jgi:site-specific DNA-methyltransferase (adenine-specific)
MVLDNTMGSGTTGEACVNLKRNFIGIELDSTIFNTALNRIQNAQRLVS